MTIKQVVYDAIVIGAGGAGLTAALNLAKKNLNVAVLSKVHPLKSHTVAAQGGINAPLGNMVEDKVDWFIYDTIKSSDYLADQDSVKVLCENANAAVLELEKMGVAFSKARDNKIYQRQYGGQTINFGQGGMAKRACGVADKTGSSIMEVLYSKVKELQADIYHDVFAYHLVIVDQAVQGVMVWDFSKTELVFFRSSNIVIATGGFAGLYKTNTAANTCTGDGLALALRSGITLQDMEFVQFHPTTLANNGLLVSEVARAEGGYLTNATGDKFMERYASEFKDLASRDVVARAIFSEINKGNGCGDGRDYVHLNIQHLGREKILNFLPNLYETCQSFLGIDPVIEPIPVKPSAHYTMGGIPTDSNAKVEGIDGLYAIGETACASVHGANRLGCNSLLEIIVFGKVAAEHIANNLEVRKGVDLELDEYSQSFQEDMSGNMNSNILSQMRLSLGQVMEEYLSVVRDESGMVKVQQFLEDIDITNLGIEDKADINLVSELLELKNLVMLAKAVVSSSLARKESRGAHYRNDYQMRDDKSFLKHSIYNGNDDITYKDVRKITGGLESKLQPASRKY